jgi:hypothetical protein
LNSCVHPGNAEPTWPRVRMAPLGIVFRRRRCVAGRGSLADDRLVLMLAVRSHSSAAGSRGKVCIFVSRIYLPHSPALPEPAHRIDSAAWRHIASASVVKLSTRLWWEERPRSTQPKRFGATRSRGTTVHTTSAPGHSEKEGSACDCALPLSAQFCLLGRITMA